MSGPEMIVRKWAEFHDAAASLEWLRSLPVQEGRAKELQDATKAAMRVWYRRAPDEAEVWLESALPDPKLDPAVAELARSSALDTPESAIQWAALVQDDDLQRKTTLRVARQW
jgi:hypothetical protein